MTRNGLHFKAYFKAHLDDRKFLNSEISIAGENMLYTVNTSHQSLRAQEVGPCKQQHNSLEKHIFEYKPVFQMELGWLENCKLKFVGMPPSILA